MRLRCEWSLRGWRLEETKTETETETETKAEAEAKAELEVRQRQSIEIGGLLRGGRGMARVMDAEAEAWPR